MPFSHLPLSFTLIFFPIYIYIYILVKPHNGTWHKYLSITKLIVLSNNSLHTIVFHYVIHEYTKCMSPDSSNISSMINNK